MTSVCDLCLIPSPGRKKAVGDGYICSLCEHMVSYDVDLDKVIALRQIKFDRDLGGYVVVSPIEMLASEGE